MKKNNNNNQLVPSRAYSAKIGGEGIEREEYGGRRLKSREELEEEERIFRGEIAGYDEGGYWEFPEEEEVDREVREWGGDPRRGPGAITAAFLSRRPFWRANPQRARYSSRMEEERMRGEGNWGDPEEEEEEEEAAPPRRRRSRSRNRSRSRSRSRRSNALPPKKWN